MNKSLLLEADGLVIAIPTYWFNMPGILKSFIDSLTPFVDMENESNYKTDGKNSFGLDGKVAGCIVYSPEGGESPVLQNLALTLNHLGVLLPPYSLIFYRGKQDWWAKNDIRLLTRNMIQQIKAQKQLHLQWDEY